MLNKTVIEEAKRWIVEQNREKAVELAKRVIAEGGDPLELMNQGFIPGINAVGDLFGRGQLFLPELMQAADTMKAATDIVNQTLAERGSPPTGDCGNGPYCHGKGGRPRYRKMHCGFPV